MDLGRGHLDLRQGVQRQPHHRDRLDRPAGDRAAGALWAPAARGGGDPRLPQRDHRAGCCSSICIYRQVTAAIGLHSTAGHPQTVRPLVAPMALAAAEKQHGELDEETAEKVKAYSAATDNVGLFFGEDIFFAIGSIVLIQATLSTYGYELDAARSSRSGRSRARSPPSSSTASRLLRFDRNAAGEAHNDHAALALRAGRARCSRPSRC